MSIPTYTNSNFTSRKHLYLFRKMNNVSCQGKSILFQLITQNSA